GGTESGLVELSEPGHASKASHPPPTVPGGAPRKAKPDSPAPASEPPVPRGTPAAAGARAASSLRPVGEPSVPDPGGMLPAPDAAETGEPAVEENPFLTVAPAAVGQKNPSPKPPGLGQSS